MIQIGFDGFSQKNKNKNKLSPKAFVNCSFSTSTLVLFNQYVISSGANDVSLSYYI